MISSWLDTLDYARENHRETIRRPPQFLSQKGNDSLFGDFYFVMVNGDVPEGADHGLFPWDRAPVQSETHNDMLFGGEGDDFLAGGVDDDQLFGEDGTDYLVGQSGDDYLDGGDDGFQDTLYGGSGADTFVRYYEEGWMGWKNYQDSVQDMFTLFDGDIDLSIKV